MNLEKLFQTQKVLDERITREKRLEGRDVLSKKILALLVELGELANEERSWKFWSEDREPRKFVPNPNDTCEKCNAQGMLELDKDFKDRPFCDECDGCGVHFHNPLLEEYVDCLHFILSIGLGLKTEDMEPYSFKYNDIVEQFNEIFMSVTAIARNFGVQCFEDMSSDYYDLASEFIGLGEMIGFTWEQIETAYYDKNEINHKRQESGY